MRRKNIPPLYEGYIIKVQNLPTLSATYVIKLLPALWALQASRTQQFSFSRNLLSEFTGDAFGRSFPGQQLQPVHPRERLPPITKIVDLFLGPREEAIPRFGEPTEVLLEDRRYPTLPFNFQVRLMCGGIGRALIKLC